MLRDVPTLILPRRAASAGWAEVPAVSLGAVETGAEPEQGTTVRAFWDGAAMRVRWEMVDADPWATLTARDAPLYTEEVVEVFVDPFGDGEAYFEVEVNPLNAVLDLALRRTRFGLKKDFRWRWEGLETQAARIDEGWSVELTLPLAVLTGAAPKAGDRWRGNFCRIDRPRGRERELTAWSPTGWPAFHVTERFGWWEFGA